MPFEKFIIDKKKNQAAVSDSYKYRAEIYTAEQLSQVLIDSDYEYIYAPVKLVKSNKYIGSSDKTNKDRIIIIPPVFLGNDENKLLFELTELKKQGYKSVLAHTLGHVELIQKAKMKPHGGIRLNITNSRSASMYEELGLEDIIFSIELKIKQAEAIKPKIPVGITAYGRLPMMLVRRCPVSGEKPCAGDTNTKRSCCKEIIDRLGNKLPLMCGVGSEVEILNPDILYLGDKPDDLNKFDFIILRFTDEINISGIKEIYKNSKEFNAEINKEINKEIKAKMTRGLYYRGVK